ncbi:MAG TPA: ribonuclease R [Steroidobacteraceae bacterium]|nr:ribonuclease R [Steroidobacteraceae bacterium]
MSSHYSQRRSRRHSNRQDKAHAARTSPARPMPHVAEGIVSANRAGFGFVRVEGREEAIFLPPREMRGVMHGDRVRVAVERGRDGRYSGKLEKVLEHATKAFIGTMEVHGRTAFVTAADRRIGLRCLVPPAELGGVRHGDWVIAAVTRHGGSGTTPQARITRRLDPEQPVELACEAAIARFDLPREFSPEALHEARAYGNAVDAGEAAQRLDLRDLPLVTIDGEDARDFDDAVYAEPHARGFRLIVAIADVSYYVRRGTALDASARERGTSVYFPTRVIPMLPFELSNVLCSLQPQVDRLCFAADMIVSRTGQLLDAHFYPAVMRSAARLTYSKTFAALFEGRPEARAELGPLADKLLPLLDVYRALQKARHKRGALEFDAAEAEFDIDAAGRIQRVYMYERNEAHKLIEECMILANVAVARELDKRGVGTLYRVHGAPEEKKITQLLETLNALGVAADLPEDVKPRDFRAITDRLGHSEERPFIESLIVRSMQQAVYQPQNIGHFGLALGHYAHFTSPIRRYPDLVVHRTLRALLSPGDPHGARYDGGQLAVAGAELTALEKRADESDRYVSAWLKCVYLRDRIGQTFEGLITTVVEFGAFVQLTAVGVDGLLHIDNLRDDDYQMEPGGRAWVGKASKRRLGMGARVHVIVTSVNPIEGLVDLALVEIEEGAPRRPQKSPHKSRRGSKRGGRNGRGREK